MLVFSWPAAVVAAWVAGMPFLVRAAQAGFETVDPSYEQIARTLGRGELGVFFAVTVPLAWKGIVAGLSLCFARAIGEFGATLMIAGNIPGRTQTMAIAIYDAVQAGHFAQANALVVPADVGRRRCSCDLGDYFAGHPLVKDSGLC